MRRMMTAIGLGLSAVLLTGGCQLVGGGNEAKPTKASKDTGGPQAQAAPTAAPQASAGAPPVSKQVTMPIPGKAGETYTVGYSSLQVKGQLAVLTLVWTPHGIGTDTDTMEDMVGQGIGFPVNLIDKANLKRYDVVSDSDDHSLNTDEGIVSTGNNQPLTATFWFAAPPANADIDVTVMDRPLFESVQVTR